MLSCTQRVYDELARANTIYTHDTMHKHTHTDRNVGHTHHRHVIHHRCRCVRVVRRACARARACVRSFCTRRCVQAMYRRADLFTFSSAVRACVPECVCMCTNYFFACAGLAPFAGPGWLLVMLVVVVVNVCHLAVQHDDVDACRAHLAEQSDRLCVVEHVSECVCNFFPILFQ